MAYRRVRCSELPGHTRLRCRHRCDPTPVRFQVNRTRRMRGYFTASAGPLSIHSACNAAALAASPQATKARMNRASSPSLSLISEPRRGTNSSCIRMSKTDNSRADRRRCWASDNLSQFSLADPSQMRSSDLLIGSPVNNGATLSRAARALSRQHKGLVRGNWSPIAATRQGGVPEVTRGSRPAHDRRVTRQLDRHHADLIALRRRPP